MLRRAPDLDAFKRQPKGQYLASDHWLYLCEHEGLYAFFLWGRIPPDETRRMIEALAVEMRPEAKRHRTFVDFSQLTGIEPRSFALLRDFLQSIEQRQAEVTEREAVVRPGGLAGTVIAGFFVVFPQRYPTKMFTEPAPALEYLGLNAEQWKRGSDCSPTCAACRPSSYDCAQHSRPASKGSTFTGRPARWASRLERCSAS